MRSIWKDKAKEELRILSDYCLENFGKRALNRFLNELEIKDSRLCSNPKMGFPEPILHHRSECFRSLLVGKHYKLIYYVDEAKEVVYIVDIWDYRMNPTVLEKRWDSK